MTKNEILTLFCITGINVILLIIGISNLSISYEEALIYFHNSDFLGKITNLSTALFGQNDYSLRLPFIAVHIINIILMYKISKTILKRQSDAILSVVIYMFLPGVLASAILVHSSAFVILFTLIAVYMEQKNKRLLLFVILAIAFFLSKAFLNLYVAIMLFGLYNKNKFYTCIGAIFSVFFIFTYGYDFSGKPVGYLLDTFGIFAAALSPLVFLYFIYATYRILIKESKNFLWFVSTTSFCVCVLLSIRQKLQLEMFLPFCAIFIPVMLRVFLSSYRVRLPQYRGLYKIIIMIGSFTLAISACATVFQDSFYLIISNPKKHFTYKYDIAKPLANLLKSHGISSVKIDDRLALRLKFYGINNSNRTILSTSKQENCANEPIRVFKFNQEIGKFYLCTR